MASWPVVTDGQHVVSGVPAGCKRLAESLALVDDENDRYDRHDVPLTRVVSDVQLDIAILKTHAELQVMPWKVGHSAFLRERDVVEVRGFPLGAFRATNVGKVVSALNHDDYGEWDHDDFVVDALLSSGNSGSPVLAVSPMTGEYELVGVFHAGYTDGSALNVVVGIDQVRDMMTSLKRASHERQEETVALGQANRAVLWEGLGAGREMFFPFGSLVGDVKGLSNGTLLFLVFTREFPFASDPALVVEDVPSEEPSEFGAVGRVWLAGSHGIDEYDRRSFDAEAQGEVSRLLQALRADACAHARYRAARGRQAQTRESFQELARMASALNRTAATRADLVQLLGELPERLVASVTRHGMAVAEIAPLPAPPSSSGASSSGGVGGTAAKTVSQVAPARQSRM